MSVSARGVRRLRDAALWAAALAPLWWVGQGPLWVPGPATVRSVASPAPATLPACADCNVLMVSIDTLRADHLGAYGYRRPTSPALDALAARGVLFERAYSGSFVTADAHMSMFTSLPPSVHGVTNAVPSERTAHRLPAELSTLPEWLHEAGFATGAFTAGGNVSAAYGFDRGFDVYAVHGDTQTGVERTLDFAVQQRAKGRRFFAFLHTYEAHDPYLPPEDVASLFYEGYMGRVPRSREDLLAREPDLSFERQRAAYWATVDRDSRADRHQLVAAYDAEIRSIDEALEVLWRSLPGPTLILVTSDHGEQFGEHGGFLHNDVYDELLHVPLFIVHPEGPAGVRVHTPVSTMDIAPTLLEVLGLPARNGLTGRSLTALDRLPPRALMAERSDGPKALIDAYQKLIWRAPGRAPELYDLQSDPDEERDNARARPVLVRRLTQQLEVLRRANDARRAASVRGPQAWLLDSSLAEQLRALGYGE